MAIALKFSKSDSATPWGFRLIGGIDFGQPIVVVKVNENSIAESAGLEEGDIVVRINDTPTAGLTHSEVHDLLLLSGLEFELAVRRGEITEKIISDEDYNVEECYVIREAIEAEILTQAINKVNNMKNLIDTSRQKKSECIIENLSGQEEIINTVTLQTASDVKTGKKWSTFLVKPDKPMPKPQRKIEEQKVNGEPYRVVIKRHPRRPSQEKKVQSDSDVPERDPDFEKEIHGALESEAKRLQSVEVEVKVTETEEITVEEIDASDDYDTLIIANETEEEDSEEISQNKDSPEKDSECLSSETKALITPSLEEQLLAVQKQLQALSQLPSAIQMTLDAVSKQLANIVGAKENAEKNGDQGEGTSSSKDDDEEPQTEEVFLEDSSISEKAEAELLREESDANSSIVGELEEDIDQEDVPEGTKEEGEAQVEEERQPSPYADLTPEERQAQIKKEELEAKRQKKMDDRPPKPIQRPIILPGGRKWSMPEDAIPSFRKPKMSDEKIIETIENNLEVIIGKRKGLTTGTTPGHGPTKLNQSTDTTPHLVDDNVEIPIFSLQKCGMPFSSVLFRESNCWKVPSRVTATKHINFLKYQPPPKNLDYLQRSEVYRLVHDMEPPVKGIVSRPERVPAVQDYYEATNEAPEQ